MERSPRRRHDEVQSITSASVPHTEELGDRQRRYAISMGIRTVCFIGAVATTGWVRWALVAGAIVLPYVAVVLANAGVRRKGAGPSPFGPEDRPQLEARPPLHPDVPRD